ncbi:MAG: isoamylase early set domain-containing protein [Nitrospira sp.]
MDEQDLLVQRFLDQELTPDERVAFLQAVDADPGLRRRWLNLELVVAEAAQLPKIMPSARFLSQVKAAVAPKPSLWRRLIETLTVSHTLEWNLAGAVTAACLIIVVGLGATRLLPTRIAAVPATQGVVQPVAVAEQGAKVFVRLVLLQPGARSVAVAGDFNGWNPGQTPLERSEGGMWTATIPLKPGRYQYMFVIDGKQWIADPLATEASGDGFGAENAVLDVSI